MTNKMLIPTRLPSTLMGWKKQGDSDSALIAAYDSGVSEAVTELAVTKMIERNDHVECTISDPMYKKAYEDYKAMYDNLMQKLGSDDRSVLFKLLDAHTDLANIESEHHYITGFLDGYRHVKTLYRSFGGTHLLQPLHDQNQGGQADE